MQYKIARVLTAGLLACATALLAVSNAQAGLAHDKREQVAHSVV